VNTYGRSTHGQELFLFGFKSRLNGLKLISHSHGGNVGKSDTQIRPNISHIAWPSPNENQHKDTLHGDDIVSFGQS
jgi:hypothetical protein